MNAERRMQNEEVRKRCRTHVLHSAFCILRSAFLMAGTATLVHGQTASVTYEVYAIRYGVIPDFPVSSLIADADKTRKMDIAMMVWLVRGGGRNILVDTGFYRPQFFKSWKVNSFV